MLASDITVPSNAESDFSRSDSGIYPWLESCKDEDNKEYQYVIR